MGQILIPDQKIIPVTLIPFQPRELPDVIVSWAGRWTVNYEERFVDKFAFLESSGIATVTHPTNFREEYSEFRSNRHQGVAEVTGRVVCFNWPGEFERPRTWVKKVGKRHAQAKEAIDLIISASTEPWDESWYSWYCEGALEAYGIDRPENVRQCTYLGINFFDRKPDLSNWCDDKEDGGSGARQFLIIDESETDEYKGA